VVSGMRSAEQQYAESVISRSESLHTSAISSAVFFSLAVALLLGIALAATVLVGRSMVGPLRRLRNEALEVAEVRLPDMVRRIGEPGGVSPDVEPIDVHSSDEIGEVARAFDQVHKEAVRLAANEAALRGNVSGMFVNLSRRTQSLVERQLRVITSLEHSEQDSERLASLFQVDHLATRMRRNSENLLVLAGQELSRKWGQPVSLVDVLRAAVSEIEQYERVTLNVQSAISVRREAVSDVVHLTAELVENATSFSAAETPVTISAYLLSSGGTLVEITDHGVGMTGDDVAHANWRLDNPPMVDVAVSRRMGLFVVARLAARHGIRVRLRAAPPGGLIALIWLPDSVTTQETNSPGPVQSVPAVAGDGASAGSSIPSFTGFSGFGDKVETGAREVGHGMPVREPGRNADIGRGPGSGRPSFTPTPAQPPQFDPGQQAPAGDFAEDSERWAANTGLRPRIGDRLRAAGLAAGTAPQDLRQQNAAPAPDYAPPTDYAPAQDYPPAQHSMPEGYAPAQSSVPQGYAPPQEYAPLPEYAPPQEYAPLDARPPQSAFSGPETTQHLRTNGGLSAWQDSTPPGETVVPPPPADSHAGNERLPIFDAVESQWFRRGRGALGRFDKINNTWSSPADDGWRAAEVTTAPTSDGTTSAGLPKRSPQANLIPGTVAAAAAGQQAGAAAPLPAPPERSPAETRDRYSSFQHGIRQGRAATSEDPNGGEGTAS